VKTKEQKRQEAQARKAAYDALTPEQKLKTLDAAGHKAERQRSRIMRQMKEEKR